MNRVIAAVAGLATAAAATTVFATAVGPAMAATRPAASHPSAHSKTSAAKQHADGKTAVDRAMRHLKAAPAAATEIASEVDGGKYVTVVKCSGRVPPKPIRLNQRDIPLTVHGTGSSPAILAKLAKPNRYKTIYTCTVTVQLRSPVTKIAVKVKKPRHARTCQVCSKPVTLNTGFGGLASQVSKHHPGQ